MKRFAQSSITEVRCPKDGEGTKEMQGITRKAKRFEDGGWLPPAGQHEIREKPSAECVEPKSVKGAQEGRVSRKNSDRISARMKSPLIRRTQNAGEGGAISKFEVEHGQRVHAAGEGKSKAPPWPVHQGRSPRVDGKGSSHRQDAGWRKVRGFALASKTVGITVRPQGKGGK